MKVKTAGYRLIRSDCRRGIPLADGTVQTVVTSPPYWGLRDYGEPGQIGLEATPEEYVARMVSIFRDVRRVLRDDGTVWLNLGDSYNSAASNQNGFGLNGKILGGNKEMGRDRSIKGSVPGLKPKDLIGIPWRVALALQDDGWWLRSDIIWCLSGGAWLYAKTTKGEMPIMVKDLVRLDPSTVKLWNGSKWTQVLGWNRSPDPERRLELILRSGERIGCTGPHRWPTQRGDVQADELRSGDVIRSCVLPEPPGERPAYLTDEALWFVGLYLAEGSMADDTIQIAANADEVSWVERIAALARHYGGTSTHTISGNGLAIRVYSRVLRAILASYLGGGTARDKHLKVAAWALPNESLRRIALGYLDGDGHDDEKNGRYRLGFTRNYALERDLRTLTARLGATLTLNPVVATSQWGKFPAFQGEWRWARSGHWNEKDRGEIVAIRASKARQFWDIGVEDEPHLFSLASGVLTHNSKPNPMPESVEDRPTRSHEYLFLLSKRADYYYDHEAIKEKSGKYEREGPRERTKPDGMAFDATKEIGSKNQCQVTENRNKRSVWTVSTKPYKGAHFAVFPPDLIVPCIKAGTSEKGACPHCGAPWVRIVEKKHTGRVYDRGKCLSDHRAIGSPQRSGSCSGALSVETFTLGWKPSCRCPEAEPVPCFVLDPFNGSGTSGVVSLALGRRYVGLDLSAKYLKMATRRIERPHSRPDRPAREESHPLFPV